VQLRVVTDQPWDVKADVLAIPIVGDPAFDGPLGEIDRRTGGELQALAQFKEVLKQTPNQPEALNNIDISHLAWGVLGRARPTASEYPNLPLPLLAIFREWLGIVLVGIYLFIVPVVLRATLFRRMYENMGAIRYVIMVTLLLLMALMPIKMVLRWLFNLKYFIYLPEFNANL